jgi:hypothetical protein
MEEKKKTVDFFEEKVLPILQYIGTIGAIIMSIAYIILVFVLIFGFKREDLLTTTVFAIVSAAFGFVILQMLKIQGQSFAENKEDNKAILKEYYGTHTKDKKNHSMTYFWIKSVITDALVKAGTVAVSTIGLIYIIIQGSRDYSLIFLGIVNLLMFISFGFLGLVKSYKYFNRVYIEYIKDKIKESKEDSKNA